MDTKALITLLLSQRPLPQTVWSAGGREMGPLVQSKRGVEALVEQDPTTPEAVLTELLRKGQRRPFYANA